MDLKHRQAQLDQRQDALDRHHADIRRVQDQQGQRHDALANHVRQLDVQVQDLQAEPPAVTPEFVSDTIRDYVSKPLRDAQDQMALLQEHLLKADSSMERSINAALVHGAHEQTPRGMPQHPPPLYRILPSLQGWHREGELRKPLPHGNATTLPPRSVNFKTLLHVHCRCVSPRAMACISNDVKTRLPDNVKTLLRFHWRWVSPRAMACISNDIKTLLREGVERFQQRDPAALSPHQGLQQSRDLNAPTANSPDALADTRKEVECRPRTGWLILQTPSRWAAPLRVAWRWVLSGAHRQRSTRQTYRQNV